ncbi:MAG TPA: sulfurtransferase [Terriglobales bacterium]|nr:sulfurtransferase [Terriglobales bacterium]
MRRMLFAIALLLCAVTSLAQTKPAHPDMLVSTEWLAAHLKDPNLVILEFPKDKDDFAAGHIPGSSAIWGEQIYAERNGVQSELLPVEQLVKTFEALGVSNDSHVVIYTTDWPPMAPRVYFTLDYLGLGDHASLLDGGLDKWKAEKREISKTETQVKPGKITPHVRPEIVASFDEVSAATKGDGTSVVDARPPRRYQAGHIPGALPLYWQQSVAMPEQNHYRSPEELEKAYTSAGVVKGKKVITYCEIGWQASHDYFTAKYLGYDVKMYDGSFNEWNDVKKAPVVKGDKPR